MKKIISIFLMVLIFLQYNIFVQAEGQPNADMALVKQRVTSGLMLPTASPTTILSYWQADGSFSNINYSDTSTATWQPINHLINIAQLCKIINTPTNSYYNNASIRNKIVTSLDYWANGNFTSTNWWYGEIAAPASLSEILLLEKNSISTATYTILEAQMQVGSIFAEQTPVGAVERDTLSTGGNLTDKIIATIKMTVATENDADMVALMSLMENELRFFPPTSGDVFERDSEGIKGDYSFHQHYNMLYFGGYGQIFIQDTNQILQYIEGTKYMLSDRALNVYSSFLLKGLGWIYRGASNDYSVVGRGISRANGGIASSNILSYLQNGIVILLRQSGVRNKTELQNLYDNKINTDNLYGGNKYFWQSDYMVHKRANYHFSVKTTSNRMRATETANGENLYGYYLGDGAVNILKTGNEYTDIFPVWDWNKVPGTTTAQGYLPNLSTLTDWMMVGNTSFVGGVSDGKYGMNVLDYSRDGVAAKKAWFMFDDEIVSLGSGISSNTNREIYTSINQCNLIGSVIAKQNGVESTLSQATRNLTNTNWVLNNGIGYIFNNNTVALQNISKTGKWSTINTSQSTANVTKNVFSLGLSHGTNPSNASYQYITLMNTDATALNTYVTNPAVSVLSNTSSLQAVWNQNTNMAQIAFWQAGNITLPNGVAVMVDTPCLVMYQQLGNNYKLIVSNPQNTSLNANVVLSGAVTNSVLFKLPSGQNAGNSIIYYSDSGFLSLADSYPKHSPKNEYVPVDATLSLIFSQQMNSTTLNPDNIKIVKKSDNTVHSYSGYTYDNNSKTYSINLSNTPLQKGVTYYITINGEVMDTLGQIYSDDTRIEFISEGTRVIEYVFPESYNYLRSGTFELSETNSPATGSFSAGTLPYYSGWRNLSGEVNITEQGPFMPSRSMELVSGYNAPSRLQFQNNGYFDVAIGANYTSTRVAELDFAISGSAASKFWVFNDLIFVNATSPNNLYLQVTSKNGNKILKRIELDTRYHLKILYKVATPLASDNAVVLEIYVDGVKIENDTSGNSLIPTSGLPIGNSFNYFKDSQTGATNNGSAYSANTGFSFYVYNTPVGQTSKLYIDNVKYRGVPPIEIINTSPRNIQGTFNINSDISVTFNNEMDTSTINDATIILKDMSGVVKPYTVWTYDRVSETLLINLASQPLIENQQYQLIVSTDVKDLAGQALSQDKVITFNTINKPDIMFYADNLVSTQLIPGCVTIKTKLTGENKSITLYAALYEKINNKSTLFNLQAGINQFDLRQSKEFIISNFIIPQNTIYKHYYIRIFAWDGVRPIYISQLFDTLN